MSSTEGSPEGKRMKAREARGKGWGGRGGQDGALGKKGRRESESQREEDVGCMKLEGQLRCICQTSGGGGGFLRSREGEEKE